MGITNSRFRVATLAVLLLFVESLHAEYVKIQLRVYGLDCGLCARGVAVSVQRLAGVKSVDVNLRTGMLDIVLIPGNSFKMSDLRKRIHENGFRNMEATITAVGEFKNSSRFEVVGSGESYDIGGVGTNGSHMVERTFTVK